MSIVPEHILRLMSPEDRKALGAGAITAAEATERAIGRREIEEQKIFNTWLNVKFAERKLYPINPRSDKASTIRRGHPDYTIFLPKARVLLLEMKVTGGQFSKDQLGCIELLHELGYRVEIPWNASEAIKVVKEFLT